MISYFEKYFTPFADGRTYICDREICNLEFLKNYHFDESELELSNVYEDEFNHSFSYSYHNIKDNFKKGREYIKDIFGKNINMKNLLDFHEGIYYDSGIINTYLRILEVYHEYDLAKQGWVSPL